MKKEYFLSLSNISQSKDLLNTYRKTLCYLENNNQVYSVASSALKKCQQFVCDIYSVPAKELSVFLNNPNENEDLGLLFYEARNQSEEQAIDIITLIVGFVANTAHTLQNSKSEMPAPVAEASADVVYDAILSAQQTLAFSTKD